VLFKYLLVLCFVIIYINFSKHNYNLSLVNLAKFIASFNVLLCSFVCLFFFFFFWNKGTDLLLALNPTLSATNQQKRSLPLVLHQLQRSAPSLIRQAVSFLWSVLWYTAAEHQVKGLESIGCYDDHLLTKVKLRSRMLMFGQRRAIILDASTEIVSIRRVLRYRLDDWSCFKYWELCSVCDVLLVGTG
jgi:hypothetical protein